MNFRISHLAFLLTIVFSLGVITSTDAAKRKKKKKRTTTTAAVSTKGVTKLRLDKSACFGRCPVYAVQIESNGMLTYYGIRFTKNAGIYQYNLGAAEAQNWLNRFRDLGIDTLKENYENRIADLPGTYYTYTQSGVEKHINNAHFGPMCLKTFAIAMDSLATELEPKLKRIGDYKQD